MKKFIVMLVLPLAIVACKDKANKNPIAYVKQAANDRDLQGTWQSECNLKPIDAIISGFMSAFQASVKSSRTQYKFEGANVNRVTLVYNTADCTGAESYVWNEQGEFKVLDKVQVANVGDAKGIDMKFEKVMLTIKDDNGAKVANDRSLCGVQNWAVGKEQGITANANSANCYGVQVPRTNANIYRIEKPAGNGKWVLYFGQSPTDAANANERPATLSSVKYEKK